MNTFRTPNFSVFAPTKSVSFIVYLHIWRIRIISIERYEFPFIFHFRYNKNEICFIHFSILTTLIYSQTVLGPIWSHTNIFSLVRQDNKTIDSNSFSVVWSTKFETFKIPNFPPTNRDWSNWNLSRIKIATLNSQSEFGYIFQYWNEEASPSLVLKQQQKKKIEEREWRKSQHKFEKSKKENWKYFNCYCASVL